MSEPLPGLWAMGSFPEGGVWWSRCRVQGTAGRGVQTTPFYGGKMGYQLELHRGESLNLRWRDVRGCAGWSSGGGHPRGKLLKLMISDSSRNCRGYNKKCSLFLLRTKCLVCQCAGLCVDMQDTAGSFGCAGGAGMSRAAGGDGTREPLGKD